MRIETERLVLREWREEDAETLYRHASNPIVGRMAGWPPHTLVEESLEVIRTVFNNPTTWAIALKDELSATALRATADCRTLCLMSLA